MFFASEIERRSPAAAASTYDAQPHGRPPRSHMNGGVDRSETVLLGSLVNGSLRLWRRDGQAETRRVAENGGVDGTLARGLLTRTAHEPDRFHEVAQLDSDASILTLARAAAGPTGADRDTMLNAPLCAQPAPTDEAWRLWATWLAHVIGAAARRGEYVVVETGGWKPAPEPFALAGVFTQPDGTRVVHVEAAPAPGGDPWPAAEQPVVARASVSAATGADTLAASGLLTATAVSTWARSPLDVVLSFGRLPTNP